MYLQIGSIFYVLFNTMLSLINDYIKDSNAEWGGYATKYMHIASCFVYFFCIKYTFVIFLPNKTNLNSLSVKALMSGKNKPKAILIGF